jgi:hypothetical protein
MQRLDRTALEAKLAVIVVLDTMVSRFSAHASRASRRSGDIGIPSGNWCEGVT